MLAGSVIVPCITTPLATWCALLTLLTIHLWTNYRAVRAVSMRTLNRQRANIVFSAYLNPSCYTGSLDSERLPHRIGSTPDTHCVLTPEGVSARERIFERDGVLRWLEGSVIGHCTLGVPLKYILDVLPHSNRNSQSGSYSYSDSNDTDSHKAVGHNEGISAVFQLFEKELYILYFSLSPASSISSPPFPRFFVVLKEGADTRTQLKAWFHAFVCARALRRLPEFAQMPAIEILGNTLQGLDEHYWDDLVKELEQAGWDVGIGALETRSGTRISLGTWGKRD
jgi:hypothetical protein